MNREIAQRLLGQLRWSYSGDDELAWERDCQHCGHRMRPLSRQLDFDELTLSFRCSLCGKRNQAPLQGWTSAERLPPGGRS